tara:strand:+ start:791 stop:964 length:174 start_codon:yes stop_codon:yes gene_type:complete
MYSPQIGENATNLQDDGEKKNTQKRKYQKKNAILPIFGWIRPLVFGVGPTIYRVNHF